MGKLVFYVILNVLFLSSSYSQTPLKEKLKLFKDNPEKFLKTLPTKRDRYGNTLSTQSLTRFNSLAPKNFTEQKRKLRKKLLEGSIHDKAEFQENDSPAAIIENGSILTNLKEMDEQKLLTGKVEGSPWSDDYWPYYKGILGARYADLDYMYLWEWKTRYDFIQEHPALKLFALKDQQKINLLSPSEKYDLLFGEDTLHLTNHMWAQGKAYYDEYGKVEAWMGICHGWAAAAYMIDRPLKKVSVLSHDGVTPITFYPSDIRSLISLLWANVQTPVRFMGGRCNSKDVKLDENGRIIEQDCFDTNPGSWHTVLVNRIGKNKKSFIMDATFDYEVWNQPILTYHYTYFNPQTLEPKETLAEATVSKESFTSDKFKKYRSEKARNFVGISLEVSYLAENSPQQMDIAAPDEEDRIIFVNYLYDLELDEKGNIIGGEWYENAHPDFLWTPTFDAKAISIGDYPLLGEPKWEGKQSLPSHWKPYGNWASKRGQPLWKVIEGLLELSREQNNKI